MQLSEATSILGIDNVITETRDGVKHKFRRLMKANHPDIGGSEEFAKKLNEAYKIVMEKLDVLDKHEKGKAKSSVSHIYISFETLAKILNGEPTVVDNGGASIVLSRENIGVFNTFINITVDLVINGEKQSIEYNAPYSPLGEYKINCKYTVKNVCDTVSLGVGVHNKFVQFNTDNMMNSLCMNFNDLVKLRISLERMISNGEKGGTRIFA